MNLRAYEFDNGVIIVDEDTERVYLNQDIPMLCRNCGLQYFYDKETKTLYCPHYARENRK